MNTNANQSDESTQAQSNDPMVDELKSVWKDYQTMKEQANRLAHSSEIPPELVNAMYQAAHQHMNDKVYELIRKQQEPNPQESIKQEATQQETSSQSQEHTQENAHSHSQENAHAQSENQNQKRSFFSQSSSAKGDGKKKYKVYRVDNDRMIAGVCGGVAEYFDVDSALVRVLTVVFSLMGLIIPGFLLVPIAYVVGALLLPLKNDIQPSGENQST